jgi:hypothetical protein
MTTDTAHHDAERVGRCGRWPRRHGDLTSAVRAVDVESKGGIDWRIFEDPIGDHRRRTARSFLRGLEHQFDRPSEAIAQAMQELGDTEQNGGVRIVTAGVHHSGARGSIWYLVLFVDGEGIHIGAQKDGSSRATLTADEGEDPVPSGGGSWLDTSCPEGLGGHEERPPVTTQSGTVLDAEFAEMASDEACCIGFLEREFGMHVEVAARLTQPRIEFRRYSDQLVPDHRLLLLIVRPPDRTTRVRARYYVGVGQRGARSGRPARRGVAPLE